MLSTHFPPEVRDALARAARTPVSGPLDPSRAMAIDRVISAARARYPELFQVEAEPAEPVAPPEIADLFSGGA